MENNRRIMYSDELYDFLNAKTTSSELAIILTGVFVEDLLFFLFLL
jgi:hypothetical protein